MRSRWNPLILALLPALAQADPPRLDEALWERRVFRSTLVGVLHSEGRRVTWVLHQGRENVRLEIICQKGKRVAKGIRLQGEELDEANWLEPVTLTYAGKKVIGGYELAVESAPAGEGTACHGAPKALRLTCKTAKVVVRPAGTQLFPGERGAEDDVVAGVWRPAKTESIRTTRCRKPEDAIAGPFEEDWPLVFAPQTEKAAGVEWAFENSDMTVQEGAYRWVAYP